MPLSLTMVFGLAFRRQIIASSSRTCIPERKVSATSARHSQVEVVDHCKNTEPAAIGEGIRDEIQRPAGSARPAAPTGARDAKGPFAATALAAFLPIQAAQLLVVDHDPFPGQQQVRTAIAEAAALHDKAAGGRLLVEKANRKTAWAFLEYLLDAVPYKIHTILTDNGIQFAEQPTQPRRHHVSQDAV